MLKWPAEYPTGMAGMDRGDRSRGFQPLKRADIANHPGRTDSDDDVFEPVGLPPEKYPQGLVPAMAKKQVKFMSKDGKEVSFMAKDSKKCVKCMDKCESTDDAFLTSLKNGAQRPQKHRRITAEDSLIQPVAPKVEEPQPGQVGFAPQGKVGAIGGGYTMDDFQDIPVLGEAVRYPSFSAWASKKSK